MVKGNALDQQSLERDALDDDFLTAVLQAPRGTDLGKLRQKMYAGAKAKHGS